MNEARKERAMQKCPACEVRLDGERKRCPLCGRALADAPETVESTGIFPLIPTRRNYNLVFRISSFAAILILVVATILNVLYLHHQQIYLFLCLATVCAWITVNVGMRRRRNIAKVILCECVIGVLLCLPWDWLTGWHGWSWGYVLPCVSAGLAVFYFVMGIVDSKRLTTYTGYFLVTMIGTAAIAVLFFTGKMTGLYRDFAVISMGVSLLLLAAQLVFRGKHFLSEMERWAHV